MTLRTILDLGRVSNLPTVWTNVLAGAVLSGGRLEAGILAFLCLAASLFYVGGMFLNDAFDRGFDGRERPERPIPSGRATARQVFATGFALVAAGLLLVTVLPLLRGARVSSAWAPPAAGLALAGLIVFYDAFHKGNPLSAVVMGLCRGALYAMAAVSVGTLTRDVWLGALLLLAYVVGLTMVARRETRDPRVPRLVGFLIAGICLVDTLLIALHAQPALAAAAALGLPLTLAGQRYVRGT